MAASDYVPTFFKNRLHLVGRPQMSTRPSQITSICLVCEKCGSLRTAYNHSLEY
jgi:hypothetical protein